MRFKVKRYGAPVLRLKTTPVTVFDESFRDTYEAMKTTMLETDGVGLAAPQVGLTQRFFIMGIPVDPKDREGDRTWYCVCNPELSDFSDVEVLMEEGCLSFPGLYIEVYRPDALVLKYQDEFGEPQEIEADGYLSRVIQHEFDHLDGVLFIDRISALKRSLLRKKLRNLQED